MPYGLGEEDEVHPDTGEEQIDVGEERELVDDE